MKINFNLVRGIFIALIIIISFWNILQITKLNSKVQEQKVKISELQSEIEILQTANKKTESELLLLKLEATKTSDFSVKSDLNVTQNEIEQVAKIFNHYEVTNKNVKIYIACVMVNRAYKSKLSIGEVVSDFCDSFDINLDGVNCTSNDVRVVESVLDFDKNKIDTLSSGALYFYEVQDVDFFDKKDLLLLFTTNGFNFYTDLSVG